MSEPTREEHAAALEHDPKTCHICCSPHHGDQAPDPLELENDRLKERIEWLRTHLEASAADNSLLRAREAEAYRSAHKMAQERDAAVAKAAAMTASEGRLREQVATLTARLENAEAGSVVAKEYIARLVAERDAAREQLAAIETTAAKMARGAKP